MKKFFAFLIVLGVLGGSSYWYLQARGQRAMSFRTAKVERGPFVAGISATGTVQPVDIVDVGAQVIGRVERFGMEPRFERALAVLNYWGTRSEPSAGLALAVSVAVRIHAPVIDFNSEVEIGTILAQLDASLFHARAERAKAELVRAEADLGQKHALMELAAAEMERAQQLLINSANAKADYDLARSTFLATKANIKVSEAAILQAKASLKEAEINLGYTTIRSPVKGVVISRRVNIGQTLVSSLSAPSLFLIAKDLKKVQVWAPVNETDLGSVTAGQTAMFTVDGCPGRTFTGVVSQIRLDATMTSNVVTYTVVVNTDNSDLAIRPYKTANLLFELARKDNALLVPNTALRWRPQMGQVMPEHRDWYAKQLKKDAKVGQGNVPVPAIDKSQPEAAFVWVTEGDQVRPVMVKTGYSDGTVTEILEGDVTENSEVITREERIENGGVGGATPFSPTMFKGKS